MANGQFCMCRPRRVIQNPAKQPPWVQTPKNELKYAQTPLKMSQNKSNGSKMGIIEPK